MGPVKDLHKRRLVQLLILPPFPISRSTKLFMGDLKSPHQQFLVFLVPASNYLLMLVLESKRNSGL